MKNKEKIPFNHTVFWCYIIGLICAIIITTIISTTIISNHIIGLTSELSEPIAGIITENPELGIAWLSSEYFLSDDVALLGMGVSALKNSNGKLDLGGNFRGSFLRKEVRELEKVDLACVDEYTYEDIYYKNSSDIKYMKKKTLFDDRGCRKYGTTTTPQNYKTVYIILYKCPKRNCKLRETSYMEVDKDKFSSLSFDLKKALIEVGKK